MSAEIKIERADVVPAVDLVRLYTAVGWGAFVGEPDVLVQAVDNSDFVASATATDSDGQEQLVGLIRVLTDSVSVAFIQDLLVHPDYRRRGIGTGLLQLVRARFDGVHRFVLLAANDTTVRAFFSASGFSPTGGAPSDLITFVC